MTQQHCCCCCCRWFAAAIAAAGVESYDISLEKQKVVVKTSSLSPQQVHTRADAWTSGRGQEGQEG